VDALEEGSWEPKVHGLQVQLRYIFQGGLDDFQKCFIDSTAVEANTERPTDSTILVRLIARVCTTGGNLHRLDLPDAADLMRHSPSCPPLIEAQIRLFGL
jgi:hypothetical protein